MYARFFGERVVELELDARSGLTDDGAEALHGVDRVRITIAHTVNATFRREPVLA